MNEDNIIRANSERTSEERRAIASIAGKKSGEARRKRKTLREELLCLLDTEIDVKNNGESSKRKLSEAISLALIKKATEGDVSAYKTIRDTIGELPVQHYEITGKDGKDLLERDISKDEAKKLIEEMSKKYGWE